MTRIVHIAVAAAAIIAFSGANQTAEAGRRGVHFGIGAGALLLGAAMASQAAAEEREREYRIAKVREEARRRAMAAEEARIRARAQALAKAEAAAKAEAKAEAAAKVEKPQAVTEVQKTNTSIQTTASLPETTKTTQLPSTPVKTDCLRFIPGLNTTVAAACE